MNNRFVGMLLFLVGYLASACGAAPSSGQISLVSINIDEPYGDSGPMQFDLDTAVFDIENRGIADIMLTEGAGSMRFITLVPPNDARAKYFGTEPPNIDQCLEAIELTAGGSVPEIAPGGYICLLTTEGNIARLLIEDLDSGFPAEMDLSYTLWLIDSE